MMTKEAIKAAYAHTIRNRAEILRSQNCCCIGCRGIFQASEVRDWIDGGKTAMCPYCNVDAVIGDASGHQLSTDFISLMHREYFDYEIH